MDIGDEREEETEEGEEETSENEDKTHNRGGEREEKESKLKIGRKQEKEDKIEGAGNEAISISNKDKDTCAILVCPFLRR